MQRAGGLAERRRPALWPVLAAALAAAVVALASPMQALRLPAAAVSLALVATILVLGLIGALAGKRRRAAARAAAGLAAQDPAPCLVSDAAGVLLQVNPAAERRLQARPGVSVATLLGDRFANPAAVMLRLASRALAQGWAREDVVTRQGQTRLVVHRHDAILIWRIEEVPDRGPPGRGAEGLSLPMLVANRAGVVLFTNDAMRRLLGGRPRRLDRVFTALNARSGEEVQVSTLEGPVAALYAEVEGPGDRREIYLLPVPERPAAPAVQADFEHLPVALLRVAGDGLVLAANQAARDLLGAGEVAGQPFADLVEGLGRSVQDWIADVMAERTPGGSEVLRPRHGPEDSFLQLTLRRIVDRNRPQVLVVLQDATAIKTLEAQFVQSQKMQAIGQLAGGIAHDFNNLLTAISGHCDLLLMRHDAGEADFADLEQIRQNANRAASLVGQLLAFSRKQMLKPELIDLNDALADLTHLLNRLVGDRIKLRLVPGTQLGAVRADRRQLEQVLMNLVVNARDAMPEGGTVRIETSVLTLDGESRRGRAVVPPGDYVRITVADTGVGIPPDRIEKIFEPFYTTKRPGEGTGLGLSTAYGIVKQSGGFIFVDSTPGQGTVFELLFPRHELEPLVLRPAAPSLPAPRAAGVVLLVEDEAPVRAFASRALRLRGFTVLEANSAEEALCTLQDPGLNVDVFVTDVAMPGMDGPTWVRQALADRPGVRVVFVSGYAEESTAEARDRIPNSVFLPKPFSLSDLTATVQGQMH